MTEKKIRALVVINTSWVEQAGLETLFQAGSASHQRLIIPVTAYDMTSGAFVEMTFNPKTLNEHWARVFVPNHGVLAIIELENSEDVSAMGFKNLE